MMTISQFIRQTIAKQKSTPITEDYSKPVHLSYLKASFEIIMDEPRPSYSIFNFALWVSMQKNLGNFHLVSGFSNSFASSIQGNPSAIIEVYPAMVMFEERKDKVAFTKWKNNYKTWFENDDFEINPFPTIPMSGIFEICALKDDDCLSAGVINSTPALSENFFQKWIWILSNCKKPVYKSDVGFQFTNSADAVHFKMVWDGSSKTQA
jgi:hypothetical protein